MGVLVPFEDKHQSKVFTEQVKAALALANQVGRELRAYGCCVKFTCVDGERPLLVVECDQPLHMVRVGRSSITLVPTPGSFVRCRSYLLGCEIEWLIGKPTVAGLIGRVH
ncbi:hypothetical protein [uncultured Pseudomonas sp.]|uniref:hypothetical protein n=1 Tax=uncultured Pseudomonas sp. TaxID=114707 RepID=UPI0030D90450|tara:strand:+ start:5152 stop:5481 length:330 start_codon:yes stop_codon:yes gene_type:complete